MKLMELNRIKYDGLITKFNQEFSTRNLRDDFVDNMLLLLRVAVTANFYMEQSGCASYVSSKRGKFKNPYLLVDGNLIHGVEFKDMPILMHAKAYRSIANNRILPTLVKLDLLEKCKISSGIRKTHNASGIRSQYYYRLTDLGKTILPEMPAGTNPPMIKLPADQQSKVRKYFYLKNGTVKNEYKRLVNMLTEFQFHIPTWKIFKDRHLIEFQKGTDETDDQLSPEQRCQMIYSQMQNFNNTDQSGFIMKCTSDINSWSGRFYALPTYIKSFARNYLRSKETKSYLVELDIRNSQFHMLNAVLNERFGDNCTAQFNLDLRNDVDIYIKIAEEAFQTDNPSEDQRSACKISMFHSTFKGKFEPTKRTKEDSIKVMNAVKRLYPELVDAVEKLQKERIAGFSKTLPFWFEKLKHGSAKYKKEHAKNNYRKVSFSASLKETQIMKKLWSVLYKQGTSFLTVHDAILIDPTDADTAKELFEQILREEFGYFPYVKIEQLSPFHALEKSEEKKLEVTVPLHIAA